MSATKRWLHDMICDDTTAQDVFSDRLSEHEPDVDDSLPDWAEWYSNYSDYLVHEYPEVLNPDIDRECCGSMSSQK